MNICISLILQYFYNRREIHVHLSLTLLNYFLSMLFVANLNRGSDFKISKCFTKRTHFEYFRLFMLVVSNLNRKSLKNFFDVLRDKRTVHFKYFRLSELPSKFFLRT